MKVPDAFSTSVVANEADRVSAMRELAVTLNNLSYFHRNEDPSQALQLNDEAIALLRKAMAVAPSDRLATDLALSLNNCGSQLARGDQPEAAQAADSEAIEAYTSYQ